jgi:hypothetical protein
MKEDETRCTKGSLIAAFSQRTLKIYEILPPG